MFRPLNEGAGRAAPDPGESIGPRCSRPAIEFPMEFLDPGLVEGRLKDGE